VLQGWDQGRQVVMAAWGLLGRQQSEREHEVENFSVGDLMRDALLVRTSPFS
jgi:hypothetical protein